VAGGEPNVQRVVCPEGRQYYRHVNCNRSVLNVPLPLTPSHVVGQATSGARRRHRGTSALVTTAPHGILLGALVRRPIHRRTSIRPGRNWTWPIQRRALQEFHRSDRGRSASRKRSSAAPVSSYLIGNHVIAEQMYRHDAAIMLHAPLRFVLQYRSSQTSALTFALPSTQFACFADARIASVGRQLDEKLAALLQYLGVPVPQGLRHPSPA
jgi:hypothetical protein